MFKTIKTVSIALALSFAGHAAHADGVGAAFLRDVGLIDEATREALDRTNKELGQPVDHLFAGAVNTVIPGAGVGLETYWQGQKMMENLSNFPGVVQQQQQFGNFCNVNGMLHGPGPVNLKGSVCWVSFPHGPVQGMVN